VRPRNTWLAANIFWSSQTYIVLAIAHSHPADLGEPIPKCGTKSNPPGFKYYPGPSTDDVNFLARVDSAARLVQGQRVREYIIDRTFVTRHDPVTKQITVFNTKKAGCAWYP